TSAVRQQQCRRHPSMRSWLVLLGSLLATHAACAAESDDKCSALLTFKQSNVVITAAESHAAGSFKTSLGQTFDDVPAFCRVIGYATPTQKSHIGFEVWLPTERWNGRYTQVGNGGLAGIIFHQLLVQMVQRGYATASTDNGHQASPIDGR